MKSPNEAIRYGYDVVSLSEIHPNLYLASHRSAVKIGGKNVANIAIAGESTIKYMKTHNSEFRGYVILPDTNNESIITEEVFRKVFDKAADMINKSLNIYKLKTVVHCYAGINRSSTAIVRYVQRYTDIDWRSAVKYIREMNKQRKNKYFPNGTPALRNSLFLKRLEQLE